MYRTCNSPWEERTTELNLDENLGIEDFRIRVERSTGDAWVDMIGGSDRVRDEKSDYLSGSETAGILEASKNAINSV